MRYDDSTRRRGTGHTPVPQDGRRSGRLGALAAVGALAVLLTVGLSGCGIRDTALPVDAGDAASRTGCPPTSGVGLPQLERDESALPGFTRTATPDSLPAVLPPTIVSSAWAKAHPRTSAEASAEARAKLFSSPTVNPSATEADGTLSCLKVTGSPTPTAVPTTTPTASASVSP